MAPLGPKPGFTWPIGGGDFGFSCENFGVVASDNGYAIPRANDRPISRSLFPYANAGRCRLQVFDKSSYPLSAEVVEAQYVADNVEFDWATHESQPRPFLVLRCDQQDALIDSLKLFAGKAVHLKFTPVPELKTKQPDPLNEGWTLGWAVFRAEPWNFRGLYDTEDEAKDAAGKLGAEYQVAFGSNENGTDDFVPFE